MCSTPVGAVQDDSLSSLRKLLEREGFAVLPQCLPAEVVAELAAAVERAMLADEESPPENHSAHDPPGGQVRRQKTVFALRNLTREVPEIRQLPGHPRLAAIVHEVLGPGAFLTRGILFDKRAEANWGLHWHRDRSIAVQQRADLPGYNGWSRKAGVVCVQPPVEVLAGMLTVRIHLDDCGAGNGPLRVLPGSHRPERLAEHGPPEQLPGQLPEPEDHSALCNNGDGLAAVSCLVPAGGCVLMRPLLLHGSSPARQEGRRRVIHLEFAAADLPAPLEWNERIPVLPAGVKSPHSG